MCAGLVLSADDPSPLIYKSLLAAFVFSPIPVSSKVSKVVPEEVLSSFSVNTSAKSSIIFFAAPAAVVL